MKATKKGKVSMRVAIIGAGRQGQRHAQTIQETSHDTVSLVFDVDGKTAKALGTKMQCAWTPSLDTVVANPDIEAVAICTPPVFHADQAIRCIQVGKHVFCEKPLALRSVDAWAMTQKAEEHGVVLKCGFHLRHNAGLAQLKKWVDADLLGSVTHGRAVYARAKVVNRDRDWRVHPEISGGGNLLDQGIHILDLFRWYMDDFHSGIAYLDTAVWDVAPVEDNAFVLMRSKSGGIAQFHVSWTEWKPRFVFELIGTRGIGRVDALGYDYGVQTATLIQRREVADYVEQETLFFSEEDTVWRDQWREFVDAIEQKRQPCGNGVDGYEALRLLEMLYRNAQRDTIGPGIEGEK